jgi:ketosteroid isomerase-like protein
VSAENVELVRSLQLAPDVDVASLVKDDEASERLSDVLAPLFDPSVECTMRFPGMARVTYSGLDGLREAWRDWLRYWATYRFEVEDVVDGGERVVVVLRGHGRREPGRPETTLRRATVWRLRDRRVVRVDFNVPYPEALAAAGPPKLA